MTRHQTTIQCVEVTQEAPQPAGPVNCCQKPSQKQQQWGQWSLVIYIPLVLISFYLLEYEQAQCHEKAITKAVCAEQQLQELSGFHHQSSAEGMCAKFIFIYCVVILLDYNEPESKDEESRQPEEANDSMVVFLA